MKTTFQNPPVTLVQSTSDRDELLPTRRPDSAVFRLAFALLEKLDTGRRRPPPSIARVFRLYCIELLSAAQVAGVCRCSKAAVIRRLKFITQLTGIPIAHLRNCYPQPCQLPGLDSPRTAIPNQNLPYSGALDSNEFAE
jgi:hypothetical protein